MALLLLAPVDAVFLEGEKGPRQTEKALPRIGAGKAWLEGLTLPLERRIAIIKSNDRTYQRKQSLGKNQLYMVPVQYFV